MFGLHEYCSFYRTAIFEDCGQRDNTADMLQRGRLLKPRPDLMAVEYEVPETVGDVTFPNTRVFMGSRNLGVTGNSNRALKWFMDETDADHLCLCNDDLYVDGDFVKFYGQAHKDLNVGLFCFCDFTGETYRWTTYPWRGYRVKLMPRFTGIMMSITRDLLKKVGYFDAAFGQFGEEHSCPAGSPVWMGDYTHKPIEQVKVGDTVIGWSSSISQSKRYGVEKENAQGLWSLPSLQHSTVLGIKAYRAPVVRINMASGHRFKCTPDHLWALKEGYAEPKVGLKLNFVIEPILCACSTVEFKKGYVSGALAGDGSIRSNETVLRVDNVAFAKRFARFSVDLLGKERVRWQKQKKVKGKTCANHVNLFSGYHKPVTVDKIIKGWSVTSDDFKRGWLSGIYDAEGNGRSIGQSHAVNPFNYARICSFLAHFKFNVYRQAHQICILGGRQELARFSALMQPAATYKLDKKLLTRRFMQTDEIIDVVPVGTEQVYCMQTTTGNYVVHGYASKNCDFTIRCRLAGGIKLENQDMNCLDLEHTLLRHQDVETSVQGVTRKTADQEASEIMRHCSDTYKYRHYYRPFLLKLPRFAGCSNITGLPVSNLLDCGYKLIVDPA